MTPNPSFAPVLSSLRLDVGHTSTSDTGTRLDIPDLQDACRLLGGTHAWVTRHAGDSFQLVNLLGSAIEIDSTLNDIFVHSAQCTHERPVLVMRWRQDTLMCASLSTHKETDGCTYMLGMLFDGHFELTSRLAVCVDGLRRSMQTQISWQLSKQRVESAQASGKQTISCTCCTAIIPLNMAGSTAIIKIILATCMALSAQFVRSVRWRFTVMCSIALFNNPLF